jgi:adenylate cyclase
MRHRRRIAILLGLAIVIALAALRLLDPYPVSAVRELAFDYFQRLAPRTAQDYPVRIVDIDEASLAALGQWPWPRDLMTKMSDRLTALGASAIVFDALFPEADRTSPSRIAAKMAGATAAPGALEDYDQEFAAALARSPAVLGFGVTPQPGPSPGKAKSGFAVVGPDAVPSVPLMPGTVMSLPPLVDAAAGLGSISLEPGGTVNVVRRLPLLWSDGKALFPSIDLEALRIAMQQHGIVVFSDQNARNVVDSVRIGSIEIPTTPSGELWLYYQPTPSNLYVSAKDILGANSANFSDLIAGNIVFVGTSATGLLDIRGTPLGSNMPGVEIHAQALQQILSGSYLKRGYWVDGLEILAFAVVGAIIVVLVMSLGPLLSLIVGGVIAALLAGGSWLAFLKAGVLVDPSFPLLGSFIVYSSMIFVQFAITDAEKRKIRGAFAHYVAPALLTQIEKQSDRLQLGGEIRELTVMFSDIRNFTPLSENFRPAALVGLLNTLFGALGQQITDQYGTIDKFMGDAIMAFWNAPVDVPNHAARACAAALLMRKTLRHLNETDAFGLRTGGSSSGDLAIGIGISTGEALVGNLGLETQFDYSCIGDTVNVASRAEGASKTVGYDIVIGNTTRLGAIEFATLDAGSVSLKGRRSREQIHVLVGDADLAKSSAFMALQDAHQLASNALSNDEDAASAIAHCRSLAMEIDPRLDWFYEALAARREDFVIRNQTVS